MTINVTEGERFVVSAVGLEGKYLGKEDEFKSLVTIRPGEAYNAEQVAETVKAFTDYFGKFGYAFAQVEARPEIDRANNRVALSCRPSHRAGPMCAASTSAATTARATKSSAGNSGSSSRPGTTSDKIRLSRDRVDRLGYFTEVNIETRRCRARPTRWT